MAEARAEVEFTEYVLPNGRKRSRAIRVDGEVTRCWAELLFERGVRFEMEVLRTGEASLTAEADDDEGETVVLACQLVPNDAAAVEAAASRLVVDAAAAWLREHG